MLAVFPGARRSKLCKADQRSPIRVSAEPVPAPMLTSREGTVLGRYAISSRCHLPWCTLRHDTVTGATADHQSLATEVDLTLDAVTVAVSAVSYEASRSAEPLVVLRLEQGELVDKDWALLAPDEAVRLAHALLATAEAVRAGDAAPAPWAPRACG